VTADKDYAAGDELVICYGAHNNDFLWVEYEFVLEQKRWDSLSLETILLSQQLNWGLATQRRLTKAGYFGDYTVIPTQGVCHRTQVAVRIKTLDCRNWKRYVAGRKIDIEEAEDEERAQGLIRSKLLEPYHHEAIHALQYWKIFKAESRFCTGLKNTAIQRWTQIVSILGEALKAA